MPVDPKVGGKWDVLNVGGDAQILPVHCACLPQNSCPRVGDRDTSNVLYFSGYQYKQQSRIVSISTIEDDFTGRISSPSGALGDIFCGGHATLTSGSLLAVGGTADYGNKSGLAESYIFDNENLSWSQTGSMAERRWYPTCLQTPSGSILVASGWRTAGNVIDTLEEYDPDTGMWSGRGAKKLLPLYPRMHLLLSGHVLYLGFGTDELDPDPDAYLLDLNTWSWQRLSPVGGIDVAKGVPRSYGNSALFVRRGVLAATFATVFVFGGGSPAQNTAKMLVLNDMDRPIKQVMLEMIRARRQHNVVILPNGSVLIAGGVSNGTYDGPIPECEIFGGITGHTFKPAAALNVWRGYHSCATLLIDGRVLMMGTGNPDAPGIPGGNRTIEIYRSPEFFVDDFAQRRPKVLGYNINTYNNEAAILTDNPSSIKKVALIHPGSSTHAFNPMQRFIDCPFRVEGDQIFFRTPPSPNVAPPGLYMLFLTNKDNLFSKGSWWLMK